MFVYVLVFMQGAYWSSGCGKEIGLDCSLNLHSLQGKWFKRAWKNHGDLLTFALWSVLCLYCSALTLLAKTSGTWIEISRSPPWKPHNFSGFIWFTRICYIPESEWSVRTEWPTASLTCSSRCFCQECAFHLQHLIKHYFMISVIYFSFQFDCCCCCSFVVVVAVIQYLLLKYQHTK